MTGITAPNAPPGLQDLATQALLLDIRSTRVVVLGGGTGLSTVVGGNSQMPDWPDHPFVGLKQEFSTFDVVVCTTDDGGSTGKLRRRLPMIGIGDLRKLLISSILCSNLHRKHRLAERETGDLVRIIHCVFNHRFPEDTSSHEILLDPLLALPNKLQNACPSSFAASLRELGAYISPGGAGPFIDPAGHSLGNLLLTAALFMAARGRTDRPPCLREVCTGVNRIADLIGAPINRIHAATATPGQLKFCYANGIEVYGESKSARVRRRSPVDRVVVEFFRKPMVSAAVQRAIENADMIIYAPGSLYTSIIPVLQMQPIATAIRKNRRALKVLGANSWIQKGETDISLRNEGRGFLVSELIEAYDRNIPGGVRGFFDVVLSANLESIPGNILRNYALEGKSPIHLDRSGVEAMGLQPIEATLFSPDRPKTTQAIQHDPRKFTLAIRTLLFADRYLRGKKGYNLRHSFHGAKPCRISKPARRSPLLCDYLATVQLALSQKDCQPAWLNDVLVELAWENRDIRPSHLRFFKGARLVAAKDWNRSTEWDNVLGYYDPADQYLKIHEGIMGKPSRLREDLLIALGESLLGRYVETRSWIEHESLERCGSRCYEIVLRPEKERECFLSDTQMHAYLRLARMNPDPASPRVYRITINDDEGFLPPGLLFGLTYAWYLSNEFALAIEYEMYLLRWPLKSLTPHQAKDRVRKEALVRFFRNDIFCHGAP